MVFSYVVFYTADHLTIYGNRFSGIISVLTFGIKLLKILLKFLIFYSNKKGLFIAIFGKNNL